MLGRYQHPRHFRQIRQIASSPTTVKKFIRRIRDRGFTISAIIQQENLALDNFIEYRLQLDPADAQRQS